MSRRSSPEPVRLEPDLERPRPQLIHPPPRRIAALPEDAFFWLGGGEVDLKMGMRARDFIAAYGAHVVDCTYDDDGAVPTQVSD